MLSVFCLLLYSAGFIRNELKFGDYDQRLMAVEEVIPKLKEDNIEMAKTSKEGRISRSNIKARSIECLSRLCYGCFFFCHISPAFYVLQTVRKY